MGASTPLKNQSVMMRDGDENGFAGEDDDHQATLTGHFVKLLEKTEERVERLERKSEEQRRREEEMTESFAEKFRNLVKHVNGKLGDIRGRVFVGGGEKGGGEGGGGGGGSANATAAAKRIDENDGTNGSGNGPGASGVAALNEKELEEAINRMVEKKVKEMLMGEDGALAPGLRTLWEELEKKEARELKKKLRELEQRAR